MTLTPLPFQKNNLMEKIFANSLCHWILFSTILQNCMTLLAWIFAEFFENFLRTEYSFHTSHSHYKIVLLLFFSPQSEFFLDEFQVILCEIMVVSYPRACICRFTQYWVRFHSYPIHLKVKLFTWHLLNFRERGGPLLLIKIVSEGRSPSLLRWSDVR